MRLESSLLQVPVSPGNGTAIPVRDLTSKFVQVYGTFVGSLNLEVSLNQGNDFAPTVVGVTAPGIYEISEPATHVRIALVSLSSGTPGAVLNGHNLRTD